MFSNDYTEDSASLRVEDEENEKVTFRKRQKVEASASVADGPPVTLGEGSSDVSGLLSEFLAKNQEDVRDADSKLLEAQLDSYVALSSNTDLPIYAYKEDILRCLRANQVLILTADTGSGKSTQVPQYIAEHFGNDCVVVTEPRSVSAVSLAERVQMEWKYLHSSTPQEIGFAKKIHRRALKGIVYTTDEEVVRYYQDSKMLDGVKVLMIDEAHERGLNTDLLLGLIKLVLPKRPDQKLVVTSATADVAKLQGFFGEFKTAHLHCEGKCFPVMETFSEELHRDVETVLVQKLVEIHTNEPMGHILAFVGDDQSVFSVLKRVQEKLDQLYEAGTEMPDVVVLPLSSSCSMRQWKTALEATNADNVRKIVISTSIAESSVTIDGVVYVVDTGYTEEAVYRADLQMETHAKVPISKAAGIQRKGRAGRVQPGRCYRLYPESVYNDLDAFDQPEIQRKALDTAVLSVLSLQLDLMRFPFLDMPEPSMQLQAVSTLAYTGCIDKKGALTMFGVLINQYKFQTSVNLAKFLLTCSILCSLEDALTIACMCMVDDLYIKQYTSNKSDRSNPSTSDELEQERKHLRLQSKFGDIITYIGIYEGYTRYGANWCKDNQIKISTMHRAQMLRKEQSFIFSRIPELQDPAKHLEKHNVWVLALKECVEGHLYSKYVQDKLDKYKEEVYKHVDSIYICQQAFAQAFGGNLMIYDGKNKYKGYFDRSSTPGEYEVDKLSSVAVRYEDNLPKYVVYAYAEVKKGSSRVFMKHLVVTESRLFYSAVDKIKGQRVEDYLGSKEVQEEYKTKYSIQLEQYELEKMLQKEDIMEVLDNLRAEDLAVSVETPVTSSVDKQAKIAEAKARYLARKKE